MLIDVVERIVPARRDSLAVLTFHRIAEPGPATVPGLLSATPARFERLVDGISRRWRVVSIGEVLERARGGKRLPSRSVLLTFDDAYADFEAHAWPVLRSRGLPAVLFVPTAYPDAADREFWWERLFRAIVGTNQPTIEAFGEKLGLVTDADRAVAYRRMRDGLKAMAHDATLREVDRLVAALDPAGTVAASPPGGGGRVLGWDALRRLRDEGLALAAHTRTHPLLSQVAEADLDGEIGGSVDDLRRMTAADLPVFAYPSGAVSAAAVEAVRRAGIEVAFTTVRGVNPLRSADWLQLRRINVAASTPDALVRGQLIAYGLRR